MGHKSCAWVNHKAIGFQKHSILWCTCNFPIQHYFEEPPYYMYIITKRLTHHDFNREFLSTLAVFFL